MLMKPPVVEAEDAVKIGKIEGYDDLFAEVQAGYLKGEIRSVRLKVGGERLREFQLMLNKVLNCWDDAPKWLVEISDALNGVPAPAQRPEIAQK